MNGKTVKSGLFNLNKNPTIGVFGHYGGRNLGDEAIIEAVVQNIRLRLSNAKIIGFSRDPEDTAARYDITAYSIRKNRQRPFQIPLSPECQVAPTIGNPSANEGSTRGGYCRSRVEQVKALVKHLPLAKTLIATVRVLIRSGPAVVREARFLGRSYRVIKGVDLLVITGSNQFLDNFGGPWGFPYNLLKWTVIARLAGIKVIYVCVGAGPITSRLSMAIIRLALMFSEYTSLRDLSSQKLIESFGVKGQTSVYPDLAYSLCRRPRRLNAHENRQRNQKPTVGINAMPIYDSRYWYIHDAQRYSNYVKNLATFSMALLQKNYPLRFWSTQPMDRKVIDDVNHRFRDSLGKLPKPHSQTTTK